MIVIIGLGNPGTEYSRTRHNIGFRVTDAFIKEHCEGARVKKTKDFTCVKAVCGGATVAALKPMMYMNLSGQAVAKAPFNFRGGNDSMLVVYDDVTLDVGKIRFRPEGRSGGQKGMQNILDTFGRNDIHRLRVGVGRDDRMPLPDYVLRPFTGAQKELLPQVIATAAEAVVFYIENGMEAAMNKYNSLAIEL